MNRKRSLIQLILIFFPAFSFCQVKLKIKSGEDDSLLPYATIRNFTQDYSMSANSIAEAIINGNYGDSVIISYVGFKDMSFIVDARLQKSITLYRTFKFLPDIQVFNCKKIKTVTLKNQFEIPKKGNFYGGINWSYSNITKPYAVLITDISPNSQIVNLSF
jgi:hypothetical protein